MNDDPNKVLLEHVERLARELREVRDGQRELRDSTRRIEDHMAIERTALLERRRADADRAYSRRHGTDPATIHGSSVDTPLEVSLSPSRALSLSLPNPPEELTTSAGSDFSAFCRAEWPDVKNPADFEKRAGAAFPGVQLLDEAKKARGWECSDPKRRKRNHGKFLWGWLGRAQDGASRLLHPVALVPDSPRPRQSPEQEGARKAAHDLYLKNQADKEAAELELAGRRACKA